jgi:hypothetical protein
MPKFTSNFTRVAPIEEGMLATPANMNLRISALSQNVDHLRELPVSVPTSTTSSGITNTMTWDNDFLYICTSTNSWGRTALSNF